MPAFLAWLVAQGLDTLVATLIGMAAEALKWYAQQREQGRILTIEDALRKKASNELAMDYLLRARDRPIGNWVWRVRPGAPVITLDPPDASQPPSPDA